jgi:hypothetical protein
MQSETEPEPEPEAVLPNVQRFSCKTTASVKKNFIMNTNSEIMFPLE